MAKARRLPLAAAGERFLGFPRGAAVAPAPAGDDDLPDLAEADVWYSAAEGPGTGAAWEAEGRATVGGRAPRRGVQGGLSRAFGDGRQVAASAPVEVPAWPSRFAEPESFVEEEEEKDVGGGWVPPHVYLARRQARASVVEGAGRTLKGRDMSRVRDAVWSRTGFDG
ncbi:protein S40-5-like [Phragmites australis]|uniref:protein S40-5-like n=1 Tax=Phragmites australis TaxID=29695 RepID=UPI002D781BFE|nr:protein S40-5-like [Phragmites australis]